MTKLKDPINHVILLMLENHSFDEMLGCFQEKYPDLDGINRSQPKRFNTDAKDNKYYQDVKHTYCMRFDPKHELKDIDEQISNENAGFIKNFTSGYKNSEITVQDCNNIMGYYKRGFLPALHSLAEDFTICDRWFSSLPGPTWPNRLFALSGTSSGRVKMPTDTDFAVQTIEDQTQPTIFDRLNEKNKSWKVFYYDFPNSLIFKNQRQSKNLANYYHIDDFFNIETKKQETDFPSFVFIEPKYFGADQNDDHPPHNIMKAEKLVADVYNAVRSNDSLWQSSLLIVVFDEHGGFYDHVTPPKTVPPDNKQEEYTFTQLGVRVPAILVSPWVGRGVSNSQYDHTSILKYLTEKWDLGPLGARTAQANSFGELILQKQREETDTIYSIRVPLSELIKSEDTFNEQMLTEHHKAILVLAAYIDYKSNVVGDLLLSEAMIKVDVISRLCLNIIAWLGRKMQKLGEKLIFIGTYTERKRIAHASRVAHKTTKAFKDK